MSKVVEELQLVYGNMRMPNAEYPFSVSVLSNGNLVAGDCYRTRESAISNASDHINDSLKGKVESVNRQVVVLALVMEDEAEIIMSFYVE